MDGSRESSKETVGIAVEPEDARIYVMRIRNSKITEMKKNRDDLERKIEKMQDEMEDLTEDIQTELSLQSNMLRRLRRDQVQIPGDVLGAHAFGERLTSDQKADAEYAEYLRDKEAEAEPASAVETVSLGKTEQKRYGPKWIDGSEVQGEVVSGRRGLRVLGERADT